VLQCVLQCVFQRVAVCCSVLEGRDLGCCMCAAVCCSVLRFVVLCVAVYYCV